MRVKEFVYKMFFMSHRIEKSGNDRVVYDRDKRTTMQLPETAGLYESRHGMVYVDFIIYPDTNPVAVRVPLLHLQRIVEFSKNAEFNITGGQTQDSLSDYLETLQCVQVDLREAFDKEKRNP